MAFVDPGNPRMAANPRLARRRRTLELLALAGWSLAFLFVLAIAVGLISG